MSKAGDVEINTKIDTDGAKEGLKEVKHLLKGLVSGATVKDIAKIGTAFGGVTMAIKGTSKAIKETTEAYRKQATAEKQLEQASKNNPYTNAESVNNLKQYASYLQSISTTGDETLIPLMAQLVASGRTEAEVMDILKASLDISATGTMSLDSAVMQLNATYSGNIGLMGRQVAELKGLTAEELKSGKAVEIIANKYNGMAEEVAKATGSAEQLKNAFGDVKEEIGASFEKGLTPMRKFFTGLLSNLADELKLKRQIKELDATDDEQETESQLQIEKKAEEQRLKLAETRLKGFESLNKAQKKRAGVTDAMIEKEKESVENLKTHIAELDVLIIKEQERAKAEKEQAEAKAKEDKLQEDINEKNSQAQKIIDENTDAMNKQIEQIRLRAKLNGEEADEQEILNVMLESYIDLVTTDTSLVTQNNSASKERLKLIEEQSKKVKTEISDYEKLEDVIKKYATDSIAEQRASLEASKQALLDLDKMELTADQLNEVRKAVRGIDEALKDLDETSEDVVENSFEKITNTLSQFVDKYAEIMTGLSDLITTNAENEAKIRQATLDKEFNNGIISEEDYYAKKEQLEKESAEKSYKAQLWAWSGQLLTIGSNMATSIAQTLADPTISSTALKIALASSIGALSSVQLASAIANKPKPPAYANGGIIGATTGADNSIATVRTGEMVLNAVQQKGLWNFVKGGSNGGNGTNINIKNYRGNDTTVTPQITADGINLIIKKTVSEQLASGKYNKQLIQAQNSFNGISYTN